MMLVYDDLWNGPISGSRFTRTQTLKLRKLTRKNTEFVWSPECEKSFQEVKQKLTTAPILVYFDPSKELVLHVDSSKDGVGAVVMQDGRPVEYASRAVSASESKWAQIAREALAVLFAVQRFHQYTYDVV